MKKVSFTRCDKYQSKLQNSIFMYSDLNFMKDILQEKKLTDSVKS